ncbi:MAG TPA: phosphatidate cytidylyltransferase, partial [Actinomycetota bacterium]|nr:phosphatidate cytidylyltransferase [Actinomycetota bacterium]
QERRGHVAIGAPSVEVGPDLDRGRLLPARAAETLGAHDDGPGRFLVGSVWGGSFIQRPLAPATSPKKSVEGTVVATVITVIVSMAFVTAFVDVAPGIFRDARVNAMLLGVVVALAATFGDLAESLVKRDMGIKDMGSVLPGHGGVLDRIDSLLFVAPAALLYLGVIAA